MSPKKSKQGYAEFEQQLARLRMARRHNKYGATDRQRALASFVYNVGRYVVPRMQNYSSYRRVLNSLIDAIIEYYAYTTELDRPDSAPISKYVLDILNRSKSDMRMKVPPEIYTRSVAAVRGFTFEERIYSKASPYDFYKDFLSLVQNAVNELAIADAFAGEDMLNLYVDKVQQGVSIRILTNAPTQNFITLAQKFKQKPEFRFEVRKTPDCHDRFALVDDSCWVFGQSIKDAARKPTYLLRIESYDIMRDIFEDLWRNATVLV
jgi:hypothetical protein